MKSIFNKRTIPTLLLSISMIMEAHPTDSTLWTLDKCIEYALENNIELKVEKLAIKEQDISLSESRWDFVPRISATTGYNLSIGRVLDETTYDFISNETMGSSSSSISASMPIFSGLNNLRQLQVAKIGKQTASLQVEKACNDLKLNITAYFLEVLCARENITNCESLVESLRQQE